MDTLDYLTVPVLTAESRASAKANPRFFIDMHGGYQSEREGVDKAAHDAWVVANTWGLTRDDFIRLSYFHGDLEQGSDGLGPVNGSEDRDGDVVYIGANGAALTRSMVSYWFSHSNAFMEGYRAAAKAAAPPQDSPLSEAKQPNKQKGNSGEQP